MLAHLGTAESLLRRLQEGTGKPVTARIAQFGAIAAIWNIAEELGVVEIIDRHVPKRRQGLTCGQYMLVAAVNRCVAPRSKASLYDWYRQTVLGRLLPAPRRLLASQRFWDHMSYLDEQAIAAIEEEVTERLVSHFKVDLRTLLFDATNFDTFIDTQTPSDLAKRGHAKSKREDLRIVGLALLVSKENMEAIQDSPYHFITSLTLTHHPDLLEVPLERFERFQNVRLEGTQAYRATKDIWGMTRTVVVTRSEELLRGQVAGIGLYLKKKRRALRELRAKLQRSQQRQARGKGYTRESLHKRLKEITKGQYISEILKTEITQREGKLDFTFWTDIPAFEHLKRTRLGKRILCTDNGQWSTQEIILGSRAQFHIENAFKQMKDPHWMTFSPAFHWTDQKLRVHASYCVLALTLGSLLQRKAAQAGVELSLPRLLEELSGITEVVNLYASHSQSGKGRFRAEYVLSERSSAQQKLCEIFDIEKLRHR